MSDKTKFDNPMFLEKKQRSGVQSNAIRNPNDSRKNRSRYFRNYGMDIESSTLTRKNGTTESSGVRNRTNSMPPKRFPITQESDNRECEHPAIRRKTQIRKFRSSDETVCNNLPMPIKRENPRGRRQDGLRKSGASWGKPDFAGVQKRSIKNSAIPG